MASMVETLDLIAAELERIDGIEKAGRELPVRVMTNGISASVALASIDYDARGGTQRFQITITLRGKRNMPLEDFTPFLAHSGEQSVFARFRGQRSTPFYLSNGGGVVVSQAQGIKVVKVEGDTLIRTATLIADVFLPLS